MHLISSQDFPYHEMQRRKEQQCSVRSDRWSRKQKCFVIMSLLVVAFVLLRLSLSCTYIPGKRSIVILRLLVIYPWKIVSSALRHFLHQGNREVTLSGGKSWLHTATCERQQLWQMNGNPTSMIASFFTFNAFASNQSTHNFLFLPSILTCPFSTWFVQDKS